MSPAQPVGDETRDESARHASQCIATNVEAHGAGAGLGRDLVAQVGHGSSGDCSDASTQAGAATQQEWEVGCQRRGQRENRSARKAPAYQALAPIAIGQQAQRNQQQGHDEGACRHGQTGTGGRDLKCLCDLRQHGLGTIRLGEADEACQREREVGAPKSGGSGQ